MDQSNQRRTSYIAGGKEIPTRPVILNPSSPSRMANTAAGAARTPVKSPGAPRQKTAGGARPRPRKNNKRTGLLVLISLIWLSVAAVSVLLIIYVVRPAPLPSLLAVQVDYPPHYLFSIYGVDQPVGVTLSPRGDRIYAAESGGEHLVKVFDRRGDAVGSFAPPDTDPTQRSPIYLATDKDGQVFVSDLQQLAVEIFDPEGNYINSIIGPDLTLGEYVDLHGSAIQPGSKYSYNKFQDYVKVTGPNGEEQLLPGPGAYDWAPLGVRFNQPGDLLVTDVISDEHKIRTYPEIVLNSRTWKAANPAGQTFGSYGTGNGNFLFPNVAVSDSKGRIYVTDGNNSRISVWDSQGGFLFNFGQGSGDSAINLPRGAIIDQRDHLYVVDAVDHSIKVYDVSGDEISFMYRFGDFGGEDGQFSYPNDIAIDQSGRLYIADRENNRIQVWSY